ncbi:hypothetical protein TanjilG_02635 [Lupinus angustifolius]|uniref:Uncharacterized protein n=1 Tax=Lupinus angustifolius TaxID=3871 RepID=A0A394DG17_LUPAN|nr:hypothetical protein TanjilG_02635 [Lupinus angustifolius]
MGGDSLCVSYPLGIEILALKRADLFALPKGFGKDLSTLSADAAGKLDVLGHDGDALGVDGAQVGVLKETNQVGLGRLLQGHDGAGLESQIGFEVLRNFSNKALEGELPDEKLSALLVTTDLTKSDGTGAVTMGLLDTSGGRGGLAGSLGSELLPRRLASGGLPGGLLGTGHDSELARTTDDDELMPRSVK